VAEEHKDIDHLTGTATTGHEWDGLKELNTPLPRWWLYLFYVTILWAVGYWIVYPAWPLITNSTQGLLGWHTRSAIVEDAKVAAGQRMQQVATVVRHGELNSDLGNRAANGVAGKQRCGYRPGLSPRQRISGAGFGRRSQRTRLRGRSSRACENAWHRNRQVHQDKRCDE